MYNLRLDFSGTMTSFSCFLGVIYSFQNVTRFHFDAMFHVCMISYFETSSLSAIGNMTIYSKTHT